MWKQRYRKTFIPTQATIVIACVLLEVLFKMPAVGVLVYFVIMELGALLGAMWTARLLSKFDRHRGDSKLTL